MPNTHVAQVGGSHYQSEFQHWDLMALSGHPYLIATAMKYLTRAHKKNGEEDLRKSSTYLVKIVLMTKVGVKVDPRPFWVKAFERFLKGLNIETSRQKLWKRFQASQADIPDDIMSLIEELYFADDETQIEWVNSYINNDLLSPKY